MTLKRENLPWPFKVPSNHRPWSPDQAVLAWGEVEGSSIQLHNIRCAKYQNVSDYIVEYYDRTFNLEEIKGVSLVVELFSGYQGPAHTFLTFEFVGGNFVSISIEIRKRVGQRFSPWRGLFRGYELSYVIADERDVINLRANYRRDSVYLYPLSLTKDETAKIFLTLIARANELRARPEFYHTIWHNCVTEFTRIINLVRLRSLPPWHLYYLLPAKIGQLFYQRGLISQTRPFAVWHKQSLINPRAEAAVNDPLFSLSIRGR